MIARGYAEGVLFCGGVVWCGPSAGEWVWRCVGRVIFPLAGNRLISVCVFEHYNITQIPVSKSMASSDHNQVKKTYRKYTREVLPARFR